MTVRSAPELAFFPPLGSRGDFCCRAQGCWPPREGVRGGAPPWTADWDGGVRAAVSPAWTPVLRGGRALLIPLTRRPRRPGEQRAGRDHVAVGRLQTFRPLGVRTTVLGLGRGPVLVFARLLLLDLSRWVGGWERLPFPGGGRGERCKDGRRATPGETGPQKPSLSSRERRGSRGAGRAAPSPVQEASARLSPRQPGRRLCWSAGARACGLWATCRSQAATWRMRQCDPFPGRKRRLRRG